MARVIVLESVADDELVETPAIVLHVEGMEANLKAVLLRIECPGQEAPEEVVQPEQVHERVNACMAATGVRTVVVAAPDTLPADDETLKKVLNGLTRGAR